MQLTPVHEEQLRMSTKSSEMKTTGRSAFLDESGRYEKREVNGIALQLAWLESKLLNFDVHHFFLSRHIKSSIYLQ